jgi:hypothetical protein
MSKTTAMIAAIRHYKEETGKTEVDMHDVARWAMLHGWRGPKPKNPIDLLAREFSKAAAQEVRRSSASGRSYRAFHAVTNTTPSGQMTFWVDIDEAPRKVIHKSLIQRREQMVGDAVQLSFDAEHWSLSHPKEDPIEIPLDFTEDVEWRKNGEDEQQTG